MSRKEKLIKRLCSRPKDELQRLLESQGYSLTKQGKTGGSRRRFVHLTAAPITLHKPHPSNVIKMYIIDDVIHLLKQEDLI